MKIDFSEYEAKGLPEAADNPPKDDLFITSASYEERSLRLAKGLPNKYKAARAIIYVHKEFLDDPNGKTANNLRSIQSDLRRCCDTVEVIEGSWLDQASQLLKLRSALVSEKVGRGTSSFRNITVDATTFTRETLMLLIELLRFNLPNPNIRVLYVSPRDHGEWLSQGFRSIRNVLGFPGIQQGRNPTVLVVLSGFEPERTLQIIEEHEPKIVLLGIGDPPTSEPFRQRNQNDQKIILARQEVEHFSFSATDIDACSKQLDTLFKRLKLTYNVIGAPMSTKLSTLGMVLACERNREVQITYCLPGEYNVSNYSTGVDSVFIQKLAAVSDQ
jgi:hypothetical protein